MRLQPTLGVSYDVDESPQQWERVRDVLRWRHGRHGDGHVVFEGRVFDYTKVRRAQNLSVRIFEKTKPKFLHYTPPNL